jgi:hypothetical protein
MADLQRYSSLPEARAALHKLRESSAASGATPSHGPSLHQVLLHCAQSIEYSLSGYPVMKPALVRATIGRLVLAMFLRRGVMRHNLAAPVPGAPATPAEAAGKDELAAAWTRLFAALDRFDAHTGPTRDHFLYGPVTKEQYARVHAMHLCDHLLAFG